MTKSVPLAVVLCLAALADVGCQGVISGMPALPLPSQLEGPSPFELPMFRWNPERETVHRQVCVNEQGTDETISHSSGVKRHDNGLTEVRLETNGEEFGRAFYTDNGRLAHMTMSEKVKKDLGDVDWGGMGALDVLHKSLAQRRPVTFTMPIGKVLGSVEHLPPAAKTWNFEGTLEYLGQTTFNTVRSAVYHITMEMGAMDLGGPITIEEGNAKVVASNLTLHGSAEGVTYYDASSGVELYTHMTTRFKMDATLKSGGRRSRAMLMTCQNTLDRSASKGL